MSDKDTRRVKMYTGQSVIDILNKQNGKCIYCGNIVDIHIDRGFNREHIIPRAIYKWFEYNKIDKELDLERLWKLTTDKDSVAIVHPKCNVKRGSVLHTKESINKLPISNKLKEHYKYLVTECEVYVREYKKLIKTVIYKQNNRCANCNILLNINNTSLRRKDITKYRTLNNAVAVCNKCSSIPRRKHKQSKEI